jgi:hypothetical protein
MASTPDHSDDLPPALARDFRSLHARDVRVPESIDAAILADARTGFARRRRFRLALRGALVASGAAAAALVVLAIRLSSDPSPASTGVARNQPELSPAQPSQAVAQAEDVDRSGRVDILDAFVVARLIDVQGHLDDAPAYDVNGDGAVDRADVDRIAMAAVDTSAPRAGDGRVR